MRTLTYLVKDPKKLGIKNANAWYRINERKAKRDKKEEEKIS
ncbi:hypothetical protein [Clostridium estertheticum]|nr:hypothetical protein [Clostridium estertheticum]